MVIVTGLNEGVSENGVLKVSVGVIVEVSVSVGEKLAVTVSVGEKVIGVSVKGVGVGRIVADEGVKSVFGVGGKVKTVGVGVAGVDVTVTVGVTLGIADGEGVSVKV